MAPRWRVQLPLATAFLEASARARCARIRYEGPSMLMTTLLCNKRSNIAAVLLY